VVEIDGSDSGTQAIEEGHHESSRTSGRKIHVSGDKRAARPVTSERRAVALQLPQEATGFDEIFGWHVHRVVLWKQLRAI
jgi:hypothetical protein